MLTGMMISTTQVDALSAKSCLEGDSAIAAVVDDRRARSRYANIARQQGKRTAKEQKKEETKVRRSCDGNLSAIRGIGDSVPVT